MASGSRFSFDVFQVDVPARLLARDGQPVQIADRHFDVLHHLVSHAGTLVTKDELVLAGWRDVAVTDNSLEQAISALRRALGTRADGSPYIETVPRKGYRFSAAVERKTARVSDGSLDDLLAPHRAWLEGRAALETLERDQVSRARQAFSGVASADPDHALAHIGLANACAMEFEMTRADRNPDAASLVEAHQHAREACRLDPASAEAWATLGFTLMCAGQAVDARAALRRALTMEPDNWRHHFRAAYAGWGEERLRAARRTLALLPGFPLAHWLAATVHVARNVLDEAERELKSGIAAQDAQGSASRFNAVALHWLLGLVLLARGDEEAALAELERELAEEKSGHLYARECCANTWYAIGALRLREKRAEDARHAFAAALARVPNHGPTLIALNADAAHFTARIESETTDAGEGRFEMRMGRAIGMALTGQPALASGMIDRALAAAPPGNAGWLIPVEPVLHVSANPEAWSGVLGRLRSRAT